MPLNNGMPTRDPSRQTDKSPTYDPKRAGYYPPPKTPAPAKPPAK
jgi:hypothetical protein